MAQRRKDGAKDTASGMFVVIAGGWLYFANPRLQIYQPMVVHSKPEVALCSAKVVHPKLAVGLSKQEIGLCKVANDHSTTEVGLCKVEPRLCRLFQRVYSINCVSR